MTKLQIKTLAGSILFEHEQKKNTIQNTVLAMLEKFKGEWIKEANLSGLDLSNIDFSNSKFDNSKFYNSKFDNSKFYNSKFYNSTFYNSKFDNSKFDNSKFDNSKFDNSKFYNSKFDNSKFDNSKFDKESFKSLKISGALEPIRFDFFGRMLVLKNEVPFLKKSLIGGKVNGSSYDGRCSCFMGTIAAAKHCKYTDLPGIKPDSNSDTERWFMGIKEGDTPENSEIVNQTIEWIQEFEIYIK